jgi:hypothetical protein
MKEENKIDNCNNGFLIWGLGKLIQALHYISPVEILKNAFNKNNDKENLKEPQKIESKILNNKIIDWFILLKWVYVIIAILCKWSNSVNLVIVAILLFFNLFTYFYYHIWNEEALLPDPIKTHRVRRRFLNVLLAISFSHLAFAYLFRFHYYCHFTPEVTSEIGSSFLNWFLYSASNSIAANFNSIAPKDVIGNQVSMIQFIITFVFIAIILSKSLPDAEKETNSQEPTA